MSLVNGFCSWCFIVIFPVQLHSVIGELEQEKVNLQRQHSQNIQKMLDETNVRLEKMEQAYKQQNDVNVSGTHLLIFHNFFQAANPYLCCLHQNDFWVEGFFPRGIIVLVTAAAEHFHSHLSYLDKSPLSCHWRRHWFHLYRGVTPTPGNKYPRYDSKLLLRVNLQSWSFGECGVPLHCHCSLIHFDIERYYLLGSHLWVK